jgi:hypothetical protein
MNDDLDTRLTALEARQPVAARPPQLPVSSGRRRRGAVALLAAPVLVLLLGATALAGPTIYGMLVRGAPGIENPGQPLHGANLECMTPPEAAAYLVAHGYTDVLWQIEVTDKGPGAADPQQVAWPPEHGFVVPGAIIDGQLHMIVDQRPGAHGVGACFGMPMP